MNAQSFIVFYALISIMMIVFDTLFLQWENIRTWYLGHHTVYLSYRLREEIAANLDFPTEAHRKSLSRRLRRLSGMESFDHTMEQMYRDSPDDCIRYLRGIYSVLEEIVPSFSRKDMLKRAYFAAIIKRWYMPTHASRAVINALIADMHSSALYTRQNAFEALVQVGQVADILAAVGILDAESASHSTRLISEVLLAYPGDRDELADALLKSFTGLSLKMRICIVNYLRLSDAGRHGQEGAPEDRFRYIKELMDDGEENIELRLACARYFMHNPWNPALATLLRFAHTDSETTWEYAAVAALVLESYPCVKTIQTLRRCLKSPIYYVRFNAAQSLYRLGATLDGDLADIMNGNDRFAREMLIYRWDLEQRRMKRTDVESTPPCRIDSDKPAKQSADSYGAAS